MSLKRYRQLVERLRHQRSDPEWQPAADRKILGELEDIWWELSESDQDIVEAEAWRAWPELTSDRSSP